MSLTRSVAPNASPGVLAKEFARRYQRQPRVFSAPGRVTLIGEHTDYNDGLVLPMAIRQRTWVAAAPRDDSVVCAFSDNLAEEQRFDLEQPAVRRRGIWLDYVEGTARELLARGVRIRGADLVIASEVPPGAGLSSSGALELSVALALTRVWDLSPPTMDLVLACQDAENEFVGVECGFMDQMVGALGRSGHALLIDCRTRETTDVDISTLGATVVLCDTRVRQYHAGFGYNQRREDCKRAVTVLKQAGLVMDSLRDLDVNDLEAVRAVLPETLAKRVRHVVTENQRTRGAVDAIRRSHLAGLGRMLTGSHISLRDDYQVSCKELDRVVEIGLRQRGVLGARMTGGGFGGSAILLVKTPEVAAVSEAVSAEFEREFRVEPHLYAIESGEGMREHPPEELTEPAETA